MKNKDYEQYLTDKDKKILTVIQALDIDFKDKLIHNVFDFRDISPQDILDIVYEDGKVKSMDDVCDVVGLKTVRRAEEQYKDKLSVTVENKQLVGTYYRPVGLAPSYLNMEKGVFIAYVFKVMLVGKEESKVNGKELKEFAFNLSSLMRAKNKEIEINNKE